MKKKLKENEIKSINKKLIENNSSFKLEIVDEKYVIQKCYYSEEEIDVNLVVSTEEGDFSGYSDILNNPFIIEDIILLDLLSENIEVNYKDLYDFLNYVKENNSELLDNLTKSLKSTLVINSIIIEEIIDLFCKDKTKASVFLINKRRSLNA
ncbi:MAG: hypothetical protein ACRCW9_10040 [Cetobacterium sp.]